METLPSEVHFHLLRFLPNVQDVKNLLSVSRSCRSLGACVPFLEIPRGQGLRVSVLSLFSSIRLSGPVVIPSEESLEVLSLLDRVRGDLHLYIRRLHGRDLTAVLVEDWVSRSLDFVRVRVTTDSNSRTHVTFTPHLWVKWDRGTCILHVPHHFSEFTELEMVKRSLETLVTSLPISDLDYVGYRIDENGFVGNSSGNKELQRLMLRNPALRTLRIHPRDTVSLGCRWRKEPTSTIECLHFYPGGKVERATEFALSIPEKGREGIRRFEGLYIPWYENGTLERLASLYPRVTEWHLILNYNSMWGEVRPLDLESPPQYFLGSGKLLSRLQQARKMLSENSGYKFYYQ